MAIEYFSAYHSYLESMSELDDAERGRLFTACLLYSMTGEAPELHGNERFVFPTFKSQIDRDKAKYDKKCKKNTKSIQRRWEKGKDGGDDTNVYERTPDDTNVYERIKTDTFDTKEKEKAKTKTKAKEKEKEIEGGLPPLPPAHPPNTPKRTKFIPPTLAEVQSYVAERHSPVDPQEFIDFYASKGWMVGKTPMKDWKAACRNAEKWERWGNRGKQSAENALKYDYTDGEEWSL